MTTSTRYPIARGAALAALATLAVALSACGGGPTGPDSNASLTIINGDANLSMNNVWVWPCTASAKGGNRLKGSIKPKSSQVLKGLEPKCYNVQAEWVELFLVIPVSYTKTTTVQLTANQATYLQVTR